MVLTLINGNCSQWCRSELATDGWVEGKCALLSGGHHHHHHDAYSESSRRRCDRPPERSILRQLQGLGRWSGGHAVGKFRNFACISVHFSAFLASLWDEKIPSTVLTTAIDVDD